jgi:hypothetical protein
MICSLWYNIRHPVTQATIQQNDLRAETDTPKRKRLRYASRGIVSLTLIFWAQFRCMFFLRETPDHSPEGVVKKSKKRADKSCESPTNELVIRPPLSLSASANKKKGFVKEMLAVKPKHVRFGIDEPIEEIFDTDKPSKSDEIEPALPAPGRLINTYVNFERKIKGKKNGKVSDGKRKVNEMLPSYETLNGGINKCNASNEFGEIEASGRNYNDLSLYNGQPVVGDTIAYKV